MKAKFIGKAWKKLMNTSEVILDGTSDPFPAVKNLTIKQKILIYETFLKMHDHENGIKKPQVLTLFRMFNK